MPKKIPLLASKRTPEFDPQKLPPSLSLASTSPSSQKSVFLKNFLKREKLNNQVFLSPPS